MRADDLITVFSPVILFHTLDRALTAMERDTSWGTWIRHSLVFLDQCHRLVVLKLPGWEQSRGLELEIARFKTFKSPIDYMEPRELWGEYIAKLFPTEGSFW